MQLQVYAGEICLSVDVLRQNWYDDDGVKQEDIYLTAIEYCLVCLAAIGVRATHVKANLFSRPVVKLLASRLSVLRSKMPHS